VRRFDFFLRETLQAFRRNGFVVFAAISTAFIALFLLGGAVLVQREVNLIAQSVEANVEVSVFLSDDISGSQTSNLQSMLTNMPQVASVHYQSKEAAYEEFKRLFHDQKTLVDNVTPDALPASFQVQLKDPNEFASIAQQLQGQPGIANIRDNAHIYDQLLAVTRIFRIGVLGVAIVMLIASAALIANTVRMAVFARRREIGIMRLVGATNGTIRTPFLLEAVGEGLIGACAAMLALLIMKVAFIDPLRKNIAFVPIVGSNDLLVAGFLIFLVSLVVSIAGGFFATRRYMDV
jgi:cell division transport system permease protein